jgi:hypothetical protein
LIFGSSETPQMLRIFQPLRKPDAMRERKERGGAAAARAPMDKLSRSGLLGGFGRVSSGFGLVVGPGFYDLLGRAGLRGCARTCRIMSRRRRGCRAGSGIGGKCNSRRQQHNGENSSFSNHQRLSFGPRGWFPMRDRQTAN